MKVRTLTVRVVAVHVACDRCYATCRIAIEPADRFNAGIILQPIITWAGAHLAPHVVDVEVESGSPAKPVF